MSLADRVIERTGTDLSYDEVAAIVAEIQAEIDARFGANAEATVEREGGGHFLSFHRPIDTGEDVTIVEVDPRSTGDASAETVLAADDWRALHDGRTLERLIGGTNGRSRWAPLVRITMTPVADSRQREEVTIRVAQIEIEHRGLTAERAGDWQASYPDAAAEREKLLMSLAPRRGLQMV